MRSTQSDARREDGDQRSYDTEGCAHVNAFLRCVPPQRPYLLNGGVDCRYENECSNNRALR